MTTASRVHKIHDKTLLRGSKVGQPGGPQPAQIIGDEFEALWVTCRMLAIENDRLRVRLDALERLIGR